MDSVNMGNAATPFSNYAKAGGAFNSNGVEVRIKKDENGNVESVYATDPESNDCVHVENYNNGDSAVKLEVGTNYPEQGRGSKIRQTMSTHSDVESALNAAIGVVKDYQWLRLEQALRALTGTWAGFTGYGGTQPDTGITGTIIDTTA